MKMNFTHYLLLALLFVAGIVSSCTKEGPAGPAGKDGTNGTDGTDGTAGCIQCHDNSQVILAKSLQWEASVHATGGNFERNTGVCATCHTSQGFLGNLDGTYDWTADGAAISNPAPQNCFTCHEIHSTYSPADWTNTTTDPVTLLIDGSTVFDMGKGNLCANCHQPRVPDPLPVLGGDSVTITSTHWGVHHGPQAGILAGAGGYEIPGSATYGNSPHSTLVPDGCVTCHMADAYGVQAGGHTMKMTYDYHGSERFNTAGCVACHDASIIVDKIGSTQDGVNAQLETLMNLLVSKGALTETGGIKTGTMSADVAGALLNYEFIEADRSEGVHNARYVRALLTNSIEAMSR